MFFQFYTYIQIQKIQSTKTKTLQKPQTINKSSYRFHTYPLGLKQVHQIFINFHFHFFLSSLIILSLNNVMTLTVQ